MRRRERKEIFGLIGRYMAVNEPIGRIVFRLVNKFDISVARAEDAVVQWQQEQEIKVA